MRTVQGEVAANSNGMWVLSGKVTDISDHETKTVDSKTNATISCRYWREIVVSSLDRSPDTLSGDVIYGAKLGDEIALVIDPRGREPLCLANLTSGKTFVHGSIDPNAQEGKGVIAVAFLMAVVGCIPFYMIFMVVFYTLLSPLTGNNEDVLFAPLSKLFLFLFLPACWYVSNRLDQKCRARAKRIYGEIQAMFKKQGVEVDPTPIAA